MIDKEFSTYNLYYSAIMNKFLKKIHIVVSLAVLLGAASCSAPKNVAYMQDLQDHQVEITRIENQIKVQPEDKLSIVVNSKDSELSDLFNLPIVSHRVGNSTTSSLYSSNNNVSYYTVDSNGDIDFPVIGEIHIAGMTREEVARYIKNRLVKDKLVNDPVVVVEFVNVGVILAGEVNKPGRYEVNRDHITILEALGMAGDLTIQGKRENVLVVREENGKPKAYYVDLTKAQDLMNSPVYYLQQNDYVYVEPNNMRKRQSTVNGNNVLSASFWVSIASLMTSIAVLIFK